MSIKLDHRLLYLRVIEKIKQDIDAGVYREGEKLPSEFELSKQLGVSRATLREALRILEDEKFVVRKHGVGTFISSKPPFTSGIEELFSVTDMITRAKMTPGTKVLVAEKVLATEREAERLKIEPNSPIYRIVRIRYADDTPVVYCVDKVPAHLVSNPETLTEGKSLFDSLEQEVGRRVAYAITHIEPSVSAEISSQLQTDQPLLALKQLHYDESDLPLLDSANFFRADRFDFHVVRKRV